VAGFIKCPTCKSDIPLSDVIDHEIAERLEERLARELAEREQAHAAALAEREQELRAGFEEERAKRDEAARLRAEERVAAEMADLKAVADEREALLNEAKERELALRAERRKLEDEKKAIDLEVARKVDAERSKIAAKAREEASEEHQLQLNEKDIALEQMRKKIKELEESAQQQSSGLRGEALERELEDVLRERFRLDVIEPIKAGVRGADVLQTVIHRGGVCGKILWESKRARNFSHAWITKLKEDQAANNAEFVVLVTATMPANVRLMELIDGVWVIEASCVSALATALRETLARVSHARSIDLNRTGAKDAIWEYLSSPAFAHRIRSEIETLVRMKEELDAERRVTEKRWSTRGAQIDQLAANAAGVYGELEARMGGALPPVDLLELPAATPKVASAA
jgi:hypothetical protein